MRPSPAPPAAMNTEPGVPADEVARERWIRLPAAGMALVFRAAPLPARRLAVVRGRQSV
jgi:hypothetical protein